jgi:hypothetical protein
MGQQRRWSGSIPALFRGLTMQAFDEDRVRDEFLSNIEGQPAKLQLAMCVMIILRVLKRLDPLEAETSITELADLLEKLDLPPLRKH